VTRVARERDAGTAAILPTARANARARGAREARITHGPAVATIEVIGRRIHTGIAARQPSGAAGIPRTAHPPGSATNTARACPTRALSASAAASVPRNDRRTSRAVSTSAAAPVPRNDRRASHAAGVERASVAAHHRNLEPFHVGSAAGARDARQHDDGTRGETHEPIQGDLRTVLVAAALADSEGGARYPTKSCQGDWCNDGFCAVVVVR
jgi:hypothetical protein